jgi:class 3 adenylate cyclase/tetratricopeptide (TPR) repeat protein
MAVCLACGRDLTGEFPFCPYCGAPLQSASQGSLHERRVVSVLFCDMVGSTTTAEYADPEDVQARMRVFHVLLKHQIEAFGGTVEKFAGDAVMAVFGAPVTHEDDAERAVRAGLAIVARLADQGLTRDVDRVHVRVGIATGEVLVDLGAHPQAGQAFVTGDVVNTAARIESSAPVDAVVVGEATFRATDRVFAYDALDAVAVRGKSDPVPVWRAGPARARLGVDVIRSLTTPLVGRRIDLGLLVGSFEKAVAERTVQLVTVVGEPGVGKSRLVAELGARLDTSGELVTWRQGRCLPYGDGVTFWALGEIVKAHLGVYDTDDADTVRGKVDGQLSGVADRAWLRARLLPLLGVGTDSGGDRVELFTAWRGFLESIAESRPTVLVFEDLHWADEALLGFLEHLVEWAQGVPLLVVGTARPEVFDAHPSWGAGLRRATTIGLSPLSDEETSQLVGSLLKRVVLPAATSAAVLARAEGNPLFAEEYVRMLVDRGMVDADGAIVVGADLSVPDGIAALLAARLDTLTPDHKALLQDAAVLGKVFWAGALMAMGDRDAEQVEQALHALTRKELVRQARASSMAGELEVGFWHVLIRDVAYAQIPRAARAAKHVAVSHWLAERAGERVEDVAEVLAHHTGTALDLAMAIGDQDLVERLRPEARRYSSMAADKAMGMDTASAIRLFDRALALTDQQDPDYPGLLRRAARASQDAGRLTAAADGLHRALAGYRASGDIRGQAAVLGSIGEILSLLGKPGFTRRAEEAIALLRTLPPSVQLVEALIVHAIGWLERAEFERCLAILDEAAAIRASLDDPGLTGGTLDNWLLAISADARFQLGDLAALETIEACLNWEIAYGRLARRTQARWLDRATSQYQVQGSAAALTTLAEASKEAGRRGLQEKAGWTFLFEQIYRMEATPLDEVIAAIEASLSAVEKDGDQRLFAESVRVVLALARVEAGRPEEAIQATGSAMALAERAGDPDFHVWAATAQALAETALGHTQAAFDTLTGIAALLDRTGVANSHSYPGFLPRLVRSALAFGDAELAARLINPVQPNLPLREHVLAACEALLAEDRGDTAHAADLFAEAATRWQGFGNTLEQAYALLGAGRCQTALGETDATSTLKEARKLFAHLGARPRVADCDTLLR